MKARRATVRPSAAAAAQPYLAVLPASPEQEADHVSQRRVPQEEVPSLDTLLPCNKEGGQVTVSANI